MEKLFQQTFRKNNSYKSVMIIVSSSDISKFQTLFRIQSIPTLSRVLFYRGIVESRERFKHLMESEPRGKVGSLFDITRITWLHRRHIIRSSEMQKIHLSIWP